jgi:hypothetical protein
VGFWLVSIGSILTSLSKYTDLKLRFISLNSIDRDAFTTAIDRFQPNVNRSFWSIDRLLREKDPPIGG